MANRDLKTNEVKFERRRLSSFDPIKKSITKEAILKSIGSLPPDVFDKVPAGKKLWKDLEEWWKSYRSQINNETIKTDSNNAEN